MQKVIATPLESEQINEKQINLKVYNEGDFNKDTLQSSQNLLLPD